MISSTSSSDRTTPTDFLSDSGPSAARVRPRSDRISLKSAKVLNAELERQPAVRPEVVERARALLADPNYPSSAIIKRVAQQIVDSPDLTEDES